MSNGLLREVCTQRRGGDFGTRSVSLDEPEGLA